MPPSTSHRTRVQVDLCRAASRSTTARRCRARTSCVAAGARPNFFGSAGRGRARLPAVLGGGRRTPPPHLQQLLQAAMDDQSDGAAGRARRRRGGRRPDRRRDDRGAGRADAGAAQDRAPCPAGPDHPGRPRRHAPARSSRARRTTTRRSSWSRQVPTVRLGRRRHGGTPDGVAFDDGSEIATRTVVWGGGESGATVAQAAGPARVEVGGSTSPGPVRPGLPGRATPSATWPTSRTPRRRAHLPQLGSVAQQSGKWAAENIVREHCRGPRRRPSSTRTRASWR